MDFIVGISEDKKKSKEFRGELAELYKFSGGKDTLDSTFYKALNKGLEILAGNLEDWLMFVEGDTELKDMDDDLIKRTESNKLLLKSIKDHRERIAHLRKQ